MSQQVYRTTVLGVPRPMGSKRILPLGAKAGGRPIIVDVKDASLRSWQGDVRAALAGNGPPTPVNAAVYVRISFIFPRSLAHYGTGRNAGKLKPSAPEWCAVTPDIDKLERAIYDCLTGTWIVDDSRIVSKSAVKAYTNVLRPNPGCLIELGVIEGGYYE